MPEELYEDNSEKCLTKNVSKFFTGCLGNFYNKHESQTTAKLWGDQKILPKHSRPGGK